MRYDSSNMERLNIALPAELKTRAETLAREEGVSLEELVRESLQMRLQKQNIERDALFARYRTFDGEAPSDLAENHDTYLYDDE